MIRVIIRNELPTSVAEKTNNYWTCALPVIPFWSRKMCYLIVRSECLIYLNFPFCLWTSPVCEVPDSHICGVSIDMHAIKFDHFLLLICLLSIWLLNQPKKTLRVEKRFFLPYRDIAYLHPSLPYSQSELGLSILFEVGFKNIEKYNEWKNKYP